MSLPSRIRLRRVAPLFAALSVTQLLRAAEEVEAVVKAAPVAVPEPSPLLLLLGAMAVLLILSRKTGRR